MLTRRSFAASTLSASLAAQQAPAWSVIHKLESGTLLTACAGNPQALALAASEPAARIFFFPGNDWSELPESASSVAITEGVVWITGASGLWRSSDRGKHWRRVHEAARLAMIQFADEQTGYALGAEKTILETRDGGATWNDLPAAEFPSTSPESTVYHWVDFATPRVGLITGVSRPSRRGATGPLPAWRDPKGKDRRPEWPAASITLETRDGGVTWKHSTTSLFGRITRARYTREGRGLALVEFHDRFEFPSEVFSIDLRSGKSERVFRRTDRAVTDVLLSKNGGALLAAIAPPRNPAQSTLGTVHVLASRDLSSWEEQPLPEPFYAGRVWLLDSDPVLLVTDTGVVLQASPR